MPAAGAGVVTVIVPVTSVQVAGSVVVTVGAAGAVGENAHPSASDAPSAPLR